MNKPQQLILLRGLPGAGKTTFAQTLVDMAWNQNVASFSADDWRDRSTVQAGGRLYNARWNHIAHAWCLGRASDALIDDVQVVIVHNVFQTLAKMQPYADLRDNLVAGGRDIRLTVLHVQGPIGRSVHDGVTYEGYINEWENYTGEFDKPGSAS